MKSNKKIPTPAIVKSHNLDGPHGYGGARGTFKTRSDLPNAALDQEKINNNLENTDWGDHPDMSVTVTEKLSGGKRVYTYQKKESSPK